MKKIMIAAAVAAVGLSAFAVVDNCNPQTPEKKVYGWAWAYKWKFTGKTTEGKLGSKTVTNSTWCEPSDNKGGDACAYYRVKASLKIQGYTFFCTPGCGSQSFEAFPEDYEVFWQTKPHKASLFGGIGNLVAAGTQTNFETLSHIIGKSKKQYEVAGTAIFLTCEGDNVSDPTHATYVLTYAGLGKYSKKYSRVTSVSGNFAGTVSSSWAYNLKKDWCKPAGYWDCETLLLTDCHAPTVAYGKWSAKFNKSAAKKFLKDQKYRGKLPKWVITDDFDNNHDNVNYANHGEN